MGSNKAYSVNSHFELGVNSKLLTFVRLIYNYTLSA